MSNEAIDYAEFFRRARAIDPYVRPIIIRDAWEQCAWVTTLTDARIEAALDQAVVMQAAIRASLARAKR